MATSNSFAVQSLIAKEAFYQFKKRGEITRNLNWKSQDFSASNNTGASKQYRRPARVGIKNNALQYNPDINVAPTYSGMTDPLHTLTISRKFSVDLAQGVDSATLLASPDQVRSRFITEAAAELRRQMDAWCAAEIIKSVGNVIGNPASPATGDTLLANHAAAQSLFNNRGRSVDDDSVMICGETVAQRLAAANLKQFFYEKEVEKLYKTGLMGTYASFDYYRTPLLPSASVTGNTATGITISATAAAVTGETSVGLASGYSSSFTVKMLSANSGILKVGSKITIAGVKWIQPSTKSDIASGFAGDLAVFTVYSAQAQVNGTGIGMNAAGEIQLDDTDVVAVVLKEAIIYDGPYQNTNNRDALNGTATIASGKISPVAASAAVTIVSSATVGNAYALAFDRGAILAASPRLDLAGMNLDYVEQTNIDGIDVSFVCTHDINQNRIWTLQSMIGIEPYMPEMVSLVF